MSGTWIELTATTWLLYQLTDSPILLGLGGLFRAAPIFALALIGGTVAESGQLGTPVGGPISPGDTVVGVGIGSGVMWVG